MSVLFFRYAGELLHWDWKWINKCMKKNWQDLGKPSTKSVYNICHTVWLCLKQPARWKLLNRIIKFKNWYWYKCYISAVCYDLDMSVLNKSWISYYIKTVIEYCCLRTHSPSLHFLLLNSKMYYIDFNVPACHKCV